jgi:hypothetical protein
MRRAAKAVNAEDHQAKIAVVITTTHLQNSAEVCLTKGSVYGHGSLAAVFSSF